MKSYNELFTNEITLKIIDALRKEDLSFSQLLEKTNIRDHGQLNYYLKTLIKKEIIKKEKNYMLTKPGIKAGVYINQFRLNETYPIPVVCLLHKKNNKILLVKRTKSPYKAYWAFPGGKIRIGETIKQTAQRIALDELNIKVIIKKINGFYPTIAYDNKILSYHALLIPVVIEPIPKNTKIKINKENKEYSFFNKKEIAHTKIVPVNKDIIKHIDKEFAFKEYLIKK